MALLCDGVLVREDGIFGIAEGMGVEAVRAGRGGFVVFGYFAEGAEVGGVDCRDDGEVVLVFVEVGFCCSEGVVEGVGEGGVEGAEGEFVYVVGEVEGWTVLDVSSCDGILRESGMSYNYDPNAAQTPYTHAPSP